jgi:hypothetical protein
MRQVDGFWIEIMNSERKIQAISYGSDKFSLSATDFSPGSIRTFSTDSVDPEVFAESSLKIYNLIPTNGLSNQAEITVHLPIELQQINSEICQVEIISTMSI